MGRMSRTKGKRGEREVANLLNDVVRCVAPQHGIAEAEVEDRWILQRNTLQSDRGGSDLANPYGLAIEVKFCAKEELRKWWAQTLEQAARSGATPILAYRKTRGEWRVQLMMTLAVDVGDLFDVPVTMSLEDYAMTKFSDVVHKTMRSQHAAKRRPRR